MFRSDLIFLPNQTVFQKSEDFFSGNVTVIIDIVNLFKANIFSIVLTVRLH